MKPAIMHLVVRDTYSDGLRIMAVTTAKARRFWGRDVSSEVPMNVSAGQVLATFTGPEGEAKAKAIRPAIEELNKVLRTKNRLADAANRDMRRAAQTEFDEAVKAEVAKVQAS